MTRFQLLFLYLYGVCFGKIAYVDAQASLGIIMSVSFFFDQSDSGCVRILLYVEWPKFLSNLITRVILQISKRENSLLFNNLISPRRFVEILKSKMNKIKLKCGAFRDVTDFSLFNC